MILFSSLIFICYAITIGAMFYGLIKTRITPSINSANKHFFSIVIALRNEENNLPLLLKSLEELEYPNQNFEIILINDHSEDASPKLLQTFQKKNTNLNIQIVDSTGIGKKHAISQAVDIAQYDWILTTDADCYLPKKWIESYNSILQENKYDYIAGPVLIKSDNSFLQTFQNIEFLSLQGCTMGSFAIKKPFMSNGANSCFHKPTFLSVNGFEGNQQIASGDDMFLLEKIIKNDISKVIFNASQDAIVKTIAQKSWKKLLDQKLRWAAKATAYTNKTGIFIGVIVFIINLLLLFLMFYNIKMALYLFLSKFLIDLLILLPTSKFFQQKTNLTTYTACAIIYPIFSVGVFILSQIKDFEWKGRSLKH